MADTSTNKVKVKGRVELRQSIRCWYWHIVFTWYIINAEGKRVRQRESAATKFTESNADVAKNKTRNKGRAEEACAQAVRDKETELSRKPGLSGLLFADFMENEWLPEIKKTVSERTYSSYRTNVRTSIAPYFRQKKTLLCNLTAEDINEYYDDLMEGWHNEEAKKDVEGVVGMTVSKRHANISKALKFAAAPRNGYIQSASMIMEHVNCPKKGSFRANFLREDAFVAVCHAVRGHKLELGVYLGGIYGLRLSEAVGLRWRSIDFVNDTLTIEHTVTVGDDENGKSVLIASDLTKNKSSRRTLPLDPDFKAHLMRLRAKQEQNKKLCGNCWCKEWDGYVYVDATGNLIKPNYITSMFPVFLKKNGLERIRFHDLRHTCASLKIARGDSLLVVQQWLGHSSYDTTANLYIHLTYDEKIASANRMTTMTTKVFSRDISSEN